MGHVRITPLGLSGISVAGAIDAATAPAVVAAATSHGALVRLDLSGCTFMDSSGISALIEIHRHSIDGGGSLYLVDPSDAVTRVLIISGLMATFNVE
ncbi:MAG: STAS domain-containing protein [Acidimicrobiales bacterium]